MTKTISKKPNTQASMPSARLNGIMQGRHNRRSKRRPPPKVPGAEIYVKIAKSLNTVEKNLLSGRFYRRYDLFIEAMTDLQKLNRAASDTFCELHRKTCEEILTLHTYFRDRS
jgi:hypothetical protein